MRARAQSALGAVRSSHAPTLTSATPTLRALSRAPPRAAWGSGYAAPCGAVAASRHSALRRTRRATRVGPAPQTGTPPRARQGGGSVAGVGLRAPRALPVIAAPRLATRHRTARRARREIRGGGTGEGLRAGRPASRSARPFAARAAPAHSPIPQSGSPDPIRIPEPHLAPARAPGRGQRSGGGVAPRYAHRARSPPAPRARAVRQRATRVRPPPAPRSPRNPGRGTGEGLRARRPRPRTAPRARAVRQRATRGRPPPAHRARLAPRYAHRGGGGGSEAGEGAA
jgi:hypothetical protein